MNVRIKNTWTGVEFLMDASQAILTLFSAALLSTDTHEALQYQQVAGAFQRGETYYGQIGSLYISTEW